jgi:hypothetical protein
MAFLEMGNERRLAVEYCIKMYGSSVSNNVSVGTDIVGKGLVEKST